MRSLWVEYQLTDRQERRLEHLTEAMQKEGISLTPEQLFADIMYGGSELDIDNKLAFWEVLYPDPEVGQGTHGGDGVNDKMGNI